MNLTSVTSLWVLFCGYDLVFNSVAEIEKSTELMGRIHDYKLKGQATSGSGHLPDPEKSWEPRSRNQTVSSKSSKSSKASCLQEHHLLPSAGPELPPSPSPGQDSCPGLGFSMSSVIPAPSRAAAENIPQSDLSSRNVPPALSSQLQGVLHHLPMDF